MDSEFTIPLMKDDLLCPAEGSYVVQEVYSVRGLPGKMSVNGGFYLARSLTDAVNMLNSGPYNILGQFDVFYSIAKHFAELDNKLKFECWKCLNKALDKQMSDLINVLEQNNIDRETKKEHRNTLKMLSYLLTQFAEEFEAEDCKPSATATPGRRKAKSKKSASALPFDWSEVKEDFLNITTQLLEINIVSLWEPPVAEEEFVNTFANCCYKFLENPGINRDKTLRDSILNVLAILVKKYNQSLSVGVKVIQLLQHFEHLIAPMAQLVQVCAAEHGMRNIVVDILREIGRIDPKDLERDASGTRCYSDFLVELASRIPEHILPNISLLLCHLDTEPYSMRNGVLGVMGKLLVLRLSQDDLTENMKNTRDQILDHLENHIHDVHAYVRSKVLQIWQNICREKAIPLARQQHVLGLVIGRLTDMSSNVRKNAIIYLKEYLMSNAFGSQFPLAEVKKKLQEEKEKLKKMDPHAVDEDDQAAEAVNPADLKRWLELECDIKRVVEDHWEVEDIVDEDGEHIEFQGDVNEAREYALMNVKRQLVSGDYLKSLAVLKAAVVTWPDYEMFKTDAEVDDGKSTCESDENRNEKETTKNKEDTVSREMTLLKKIFLNPEFGPAVSNPEQGNEDQDQAENADPDSLVNEVSKQQIVIQYLKDYISFHTQYQHALLVVCRLLGSQVSSDVHESIEFVVIAYEFGLNNALLVVRRMLSLVWSKDNDIKSKVVDAYTRLYLNPQVQGQRAKAEAIVKNLFALLDGASIGDLTSLNELVYKLMKTSLIPKNVIHLLWEKFAMKDPQTTQEQSKSALKLLGMLARGKHEIVKSNIEVLVNIGLGDRAKDDALLVRDTCTILLTLNKTEEKVRDDKQGPLRFSSDHMMFQRLNDILVNSITSPVQGMWVPMAEEAINVVYNLAEHPDTICGHLIKNLIKKFFGEEENLDGSDANIDKASEETPAPVSCPSYVFARFLAAAGHIALQQVVHLETSVLGEIKRRERLKEDSKGEKKKRTSTSVSQTPRTKEGTGETLEDEMGLTGATAEDAEAEYIKKICDHEIVTGGNNLLSLLGSLIVIVCNNPTKYSDLQVQTAASLALSKFMLVSVEFCEKNLQLLFTILEKSRHEVIRSNTIISLGDLTPRFPNLIEPWTPNLYARLRDDSSQVRMNTMKIMTRLILNDMVKVKGQISEMATCLEDDDSRIAELAKSFFSELSKKGNAVYNILPDVISRLSDPDTGIEEAPFRNITSYLFSFIQKDRQCESLVEKLCHRFRATRTDRQWIDLSFCLAQLSYNERSLRKLQENFACFQGTLSNDDVFGFFSTIMGKCKKMAKPEIKVVVEELELRITTCHEKGVEEEAGYERANQASAAARVLVGKAANTPANKKTRSTRGRTPASRRRRKNDSESEVVPKPQTGKKSTRKSRKKVIEFDSDDEEMMEGNWDEAFEAEKENVEV